MRKTIPNQSLFIFLLQLSLSSMCLAQTDDADADDERVDGRFLLDLSYTSTDAFEGVADVFTPGFTWLLGADLRIGASTTYVTFDLSSELKPENKHNSHGLGDSVFFVQYDWDERLTASPWVPDDVGMSLSLLVPTGDAESFLSNDTWAANLSTSWPILMEGKWLFNPVVSYSFTFNEGLLADPVSALDFGLGVVRLFPSRFWIGYTPTVWFNFKTDTWNFDDHFTIGKMFSNGMGVGLDYGYLARNSKLFARYDDTLMLNFYYQFGR